MANPKTLQKRRYVTNELEGEVIDKIEIGDSSLKIIFTDKSLIFIVSTADGYLLANYEDNKRIKVIV